VDARIESGILPKPVEKPIHWFLLVVIVQEIQLKRIVSYNM